MFHDMRKTDWLTAAEVAEILDAPRTSVTRWAREGKLRAIRTPGGRFKFRRDDIEKFAPENLRRAAS